jgi:hypothetical protein
MRQRSKYFGLNNVAERRWTLENLKIETLGALSVRSIAERSQTISCIGSTVRFQIEETNCDA